MTVHALLSPSSAARWLACGAAPLMERGRPDEASPFAAEGTAAHEAAAIALLTESPVQPHGGLPADDLPAVQSYVDYVRQLASEEGAQLYIEQQLDISSITGEEGAVGTADAVIYTHAETIVVDLKFGRGVRVDAERNPQLLLYGAAALQLHQRAALRLVVHQPRLSHVSEWRCSSADAADFAQEVQGKAQRALDILAQGSAADADFCPGQEQCRFCRARATCPALAAKVQQEVGADFAQLAHEGGSKEAAAQGVQQLMPADAEMLARALPAVPLIEAWCRAVTAEAERRLLAGEPVRGYKMVAGRAGARIWTSAADAEAALKAMRIKEADMYERKLISPPAAEKLAKAGTIGKRQWPKLQALITRREAKPALAPESDPRPAYSAAATAAEFAEEARNEQS